MSAEHEREEVSRWEWVAAACSTLLVAGVIGVLLREALGPPPSPPGIEIEVESISRTGGAYLVEFRATNVGRTTAAALQVEGELSAGGEMVERSGVTIDYLPGEGSRRAGIYFSNDPARYRLRVRPTGYDLP
jgi:uncharacterized protein (TIGR02588 family)